MTDTTSQTPAPHASAPALTLGDRARLRVLKWRLDWHLEGRVPHRRRNEITREVRANVVVAAGDHGGRGRHRAPRGRAGGRARVRGGRGVAGPGARRVHRRGGGGDGAVPPRPGGERRVLRGARAVAGDEPSWSYAWEIAEGFGPFASSHDAEEGSYTVTVLSPFHLLAGVVAFVLGARLWRWRPAGRR